MELINKGSKVRFILGEDTTLPIEHIKAILPLRKQG
jgi:hypothetical protein